jgi:hypothetical protein
MARLTLVLISTLALFGCGQRAERGAPAAAGVETPAAAGGANRYLAYEHSVAIDTDDDKVATLFDAAQSACREAVAESCAILDARVTRSEASYATLRFRAKPAGIRKLLAMLSDQGKVTSLATTAEDLAGPIEDTAKQLAMLTDYRSRLEALRGRGSNDVDALIKLNRELADVQSQIEALSGSQARLVQRVDTEILNVTISSYESRSFWSPIGESTSDFGGHLSEGIATAITALAYIIPWGLIVAFIVWVVRKLWGRRKRNTASA